MKASRFVMALVLVFTTVLVGQAAELHVLLEVDGPTEQQVLQDLTNEFMDQNPDVDITLEFLSWNPLKEKLVLMMAGGAAPDVFTLGDGWEVEFAPMLLPLDEYLEAWDEYRDYIPNTLEGCRYNGVTYGLPYRANPWITLYNGGYFLESGLDPDRPPQTWADMSMMAKRLVQTDASGAITRSGAIHYAAPVSYTYHAYIIRALLGQNGVDWATFFNRDTLVSNAKSSATREALEYYVSFERNGWSAWTGNWNQFAAGNTAIVPAGQFSDVQGWRTSHPMNAEDARAALPLMQVRRAAPMPVDKWSISRTTPDPDLAVKYLLFLSSRDNLGRYLSTLGSVPARRSLGRLEYVRKDREAQVFVESLAYGMPLPRSIYVEKVASALGKVGSDMLYDKAPFDIAVEEMLVAIQALGI